MPANSRMFAACIAKNARRFAIPAKKTRNGLRSIVVTQRIDEAHPDFDHQSCDRCELLG